MKQEEIEKILMNFKDNKITLKEATLYVEDAVMSKVQDEIWNRLYKFLKKKFTQKIEKAKKLQDFLDIRTELLYCPDCASTALIRRSLHMKAKEILSPEDYEKL